MGHIHAAAMAEYAKDATETNTPWERWEFSCGGPNFKSLITHPQWNEDFKYRAIKNNPEQRERITRRTAEVTLVE